LEQTFNGRPPELTDTERDVIAGGVKLQLPRFLATAEKNILWRTLNNLPGLVDLAKSYPDTNLGKQAQQRVDKMDRALLQVLDSSTPAVPDADVQTAAPAQRNDAGDEQGAGRLNKPHDSQVAAVSDGRRTLVLVGLVGLVVAVAGIAIWMRRPARRPAVTDKR
jgi:hypothetical protein